MARQPIDDLIDKPLNELTEEEAQIVIEWQAQARFKEYQKSEQHKELINSNNRIADIEKEKAQAALDTLDELKARALAFYNEQ